MLTGKGFFQIEKNRYNLSCCIIYAYILTYNGEGWLCRYLNPAILISIKARHLVLHWVRRAQSKTNKKAIKGLRKRCTGKNGMRSGKQSTGVKKNIMDILMIKWLIAYLLDYCGKWKLVNAYYNWEGFWNDSGHFHTWIPFLCCGLLHLKFVSIYLLSPTIFTAKTIAFRSNSWWYPTNWSSNKHFATLAAISGYKIVRAARAT